MATNIVTSIGNEGCVKRKKNSITTEIQLTEVCAGQINGECNKTGMFYQLTLLFVSCIAMIKNGFLVFLMITRNEKCRKRGFPYTVYKLGRNKKHVSSLFVDGFSKWNAQAKWGATTCDSLELFYHYQERVFPNLGNNFEGFITKWWIGKMENRQAVTNRLKMVIGLLAVEISKQENPRILSIASGSADAVIAAIKKCPDKDVQVVLIDVNQDSLDAAKKAATEAGIVNCFQFVKTSYARAFTYLKTFKPNIVEMVGFLDYLDDAMATRLFKAIKNGLPASGVFLTCNIIPNKEKIFLDCVLLWNMIYRTVDEMKTLVDDAGFSRGKSEIYLEPLGIHQVAVCRK